MKQLKIDPDELRKKRLFVATPMYGHQCAGIYDVSMGSTIGLLEHLGIYYLKKPRGNESCITRARNYFAGEFMRSDCTHILWWDSDVGAPAEYALQLLALCEGDKDIIGGPYCAKAINWKLVHKAACAGVPPEELERFSGHYVVNFLPGSTGIELSEGPQEVYTIGAGFTMMQRSVFERMNETAISYVPDGLSDDRGYPIRAYFGNGVIGDRWFTEDYWFCDRAKHLGMKIWVCPWMKLQHQGSYIFRGQFGAEALLNAEPS